MSLVTPRVDTSISLYNTTSIETYAVDSNMQDRLKEIETSTDGVQTVSTNTGAGNTDYSNKEVSSAEIQQYWVWIQKYAKEKNLDPLWVAAIIAEESSFNAKCTSQTGNKGLMQLTDNATNRKTFNFTDAFDPEQNIRGGCGMFNYDLETAGSTYNVSDRSNPLGQQYMYGMCLYGCWTHPKVWASSAEGYLAYNKVRTIYQQYVSGAAKIGDRCDSLINSKYAKEIKQGYATSPDMK